MSILFITSTRIGDAILSTGLLARLLEDHPAERVTIACGASAAMLFEATPRLERIHVLRKRPWNRHWLDLWRELRGRRWEIIVDLRRSVMPFLLRARRKAVLPRADERLHRVALISMTLGLPPQAPVIWTGEAHEARAAALLGSGGDVLAIAPGATWFPKMWPVERFAELAERLTGAGGQLAGGRVLLIGGSGDREAARPVIEALPPDRLVDGFGLDLLSTYAALRRCRLMVGNDSGMMHLAAASGIPTVGLFGPTREEHYGPWGENGLVVRTPQSAQELVGTPGFNARTAGVLMKDLQVVEVETAIRARWPRLP